MMNSAAGYKREEVVTCPYDKSHRILRHKLQTHMVRCGRNHEGTVFKFCRFNPCHILSEEEFEKHLNICPDRYEIDKYIYTPDNVDKDKYPVHKEDVNSGESWDDVQENTYNPEDYLAKKPVLRKVDTMSASYRNTFRNESVLRCRELTSHAGANYKGDDGLHTVRKPTTAVDTGEQILEEEPEYVSREIYEMQMSLQPQKEKTKENCPPPLSQILIDAQKKADDQKKEEAKKRAEESESDCWAVPRHKSSRGRRGGSMGQSRGG